MQMNHYSTSTVNIAEQCLLDTRGLICFKLNYSSNRQDKAGKIIQGYIAIENT